MRAESLRFFHDLVDAAGPSGDERAATRVWRAYVEGFARFGGDAIGSGFATVEGNGAGPHIGLFGHIDEIGLVITHVDDEGFLWFSNVGGWDGNVLVGQRVRILTRGGPLAGVIGKKAIHHMDDEERKQAPKLEDLWIDIGAAGAEDARKRVRVGDLAVVDQPTVELGAGQVAVRAADNRCGAWVVAEAARLYADSSGAARVTAVASVSEEISFAGAYAASFDLAPDIAVAVDVTNATDYPSTEKKRFGDVRLGRGPSISRGASISPALFDVVASVAEADGIPIQVEPSGGSTYTDGDAVHVSRRGVPIVVVSIPLRYMHSPVEVLHLGDLERCAALVAAVCRRLDAIPDPLA